MISVFSFVRVSNFVSRGVNSTTNDLPDLGHVSFKEKLMKDLIRILKIYLPIKRHKLNIIKEIIVFMKFTLIST